MRISTVVVSDVSDHDVRNFVLKVQILRDQNVFEPDTHEAMMRLEDEYPELATHRQILSTEDTELGRMLYEARITFREIRRVILKQLEEQRIK